MLSGWVCVCLGCASSPSSPDVERVAPAVTPEAPAGSELSPLADDEAALRAMSGVYDVSIVVSGSGGLVEDRRGTSVSAREAVIVEPGAASGQWVMEHLLLVGEPAAVARHWSSTWTPTPSGTWRVVEAEADGRPNSTVMGRWTHEALPGADTGDGARAAAVSRFVPEAGSVRAVTTRSPGLAGLEGRWWASTVVRVGPGVGWTRTTEGQLLGNEGRPRGGSVTRTEAYAPVAQGGESAWAAAQAWWSERRAFWSAVRAWWEVRGTVEFADVVAGVPMWRAVLDLEAAVRRGQAVADPATLDAVLGAYVVE